jgi:hypothetical protein
MCLRPEPGSAGIPVVSRLSNPAVRDWRVQAGVSVGLVRDQRGMARCLFAVASSTASAGVSRSAAHARLQKHHRHHHRRHHRQVVRKPTIGPGGDRDGDNSGAPSDGDGGI